MTYDFTQEFVEPSVVIDSSGRVEVKLSTDDGEITLLFLVPDFEDLVDMFYKGLEE